MAASLVSSITVCYHLHVWMSACCYGVGLLYIHVFIYLQTVDLQIVFVVNKSGKNCTCTCMYILHCGHSGFALFTYNVALCSHTCTHIYKAPVVYYLPFVCYAADITVSFALSSASVLENSSMACLDVNVTGFFPDPNITTLSTYFVFYTRPDTAEGNSYLFI